MLFRSSTGLTRATARRLLHTLVALGFADTDGKWFELTPKVLDLGHAYVSSLQLPDIAQPFMEALSEKVHESVSASVLDGDEIVYVARVPTQRIMAISLAIGSRLPAVWTSMGRVMLAGRTDARWVVDPIDGTVNFTYGIPHACVSIALQVRDAHSKFPGDPLRGYRTLVGVVYDPFLDEMWTAVRGEKAKLNGQPISVSRRTRLDEAIVAMG